MHTNKLYTKAHINTQTWFNNNQLQLYFTSTRVECSKKLLTHKQGDPAAGTATQVVNSLALPNLPFLASFFSNNQTA